jgi:hypothetical protein
LCVAGRCVRLINGWIVLVEARNAKDLSRLGGGQSGGVGFLEGDEAAGEL